MADPDVDLVYIATPHSLHAEQAILCMKAGKNVLVEKSFTANAGQAREALAVAEETGMLCTEAIWTRYMPSRKLINEVIESGEIGEVKAASANLCYPVSGKARMTDPACAGGALLDVGVYPLNFLDMAIGADHGRTLDHFDTSMMAAETGVDAQNSTTLYYDDGTMAVSTSSMLVSSDRGGYVWGTEGYLVVTNINNPESIDIYNNDHKPVRSVAVPSQLTGYEYEVADAANALLDGKLYQLTWQNNKAFVYDLETFDKVGEFDYSGEGWGLTTDGKHLYMSDGSEKIYVLDPETFRRIRTIEVYTDQSKVAYVNEMEWIKGEIWANVYMTDTIIRIDPQTGAVTGAIDMSGLLSEADVTPATDVLNGIAYDARTGRIFVTGKNWNKLFEISVHPK